MMRAMIPRKRKAMTRRKRTSDGFWLRVTSLVEVLNFWTGRVESSLCCFAQVVACTVFDRGNEAMPVI